MRECLYKNGFFVVDNFFEKKLCDFLRKSALEYEYFEDLYQDYVAVNYDSLGCKNKKISGLVSNTIPQLLKEQYPFLTENGYDYQRGWYFIHDNHQHSSVQRHRDPGAYITVNLWVTPDKYRDNFSSEYNGFIIHTPNQSVGIPYKFNRMTMFFSQLEHQSQLSRFKFNKKNKRKVNFTFLFGPSI